MKLYAAAGTTFPPVKKYRPDSKEKALRRLDDFKLVEKELYKQIKVGDIILLTMRMPYHFGGAYFESTETDFIFIKKDGSFGSQENHYDEWNASVLNLANTAQQQGAKVIIQTPTPEWDKEYKISRCSTVDKAWFNSLNKTNCQIKSKFFIDEEKGVYKHLFEKLNKLSFSHKNLYLFNTYKFVCPESICSFTRDGVDIYNDEDHLSHGWARDFLAPKIYKFIQDIKL